MVFYFIFGVLAAFGMLCVLWVLLGHFLPGSSCAVAVCCAAGEETAVLRRYLWLRELGFTRSRLVLLDSNLPASQQKFWEEKCPSVRFLTLEQWITDGKQEGENLD